MWDEKLMCTGKRTYRKKDAQTAVNARNKGTTGRKVSEKRLRMYQCPLCGFWHLSSNPPAN